MSQSTAESGNKYNISVVSRAIRVLRSFTLASPSLTLSEVAAATDLPLPTTLRILATLRSHGLILRDPRTELYSLGYELLSMADVVRAADGLQSVARPIMMQLRDQTNETVILAVPDGDTRMNVLQCESNHELRRVMVMGARWPLYAGAGGKAILAHMPDAAFEAYLKRTELRPLTPRTVIDKDVLRQDIRRIRELGYAESEQEQSQTGALSFACAVEGPRGECVATLAVTLPVMRMTPEMRGPIVAALKTAVQMVSAQLCGDPQA